MCYFLLSVFSLSKVIKIIMSMVLKFTSLAHTSPLHLVYICKGELFFLLKLVFTHTHTHTPNPFFPISVKGLNISQLLKQNLTLGLDSSGLTFGSTLSLNPSYPIQKACVLYCILYCGRGPNHLLPGPQ